MVHRARRNGRSLAPSPRPSGCSRPSGDAGRSRPRPECRRSPEAQQLKARPVRGNRIAGGTDRWVPVAKRARCTRRSDQPRLRAQEREPVGRGWHDHWAAAGSRCGSSSGSPGGACQKLLLPDKSSPHPRVPTQDEPHESKQNPTPTRKYRTQVVPEGLAAGHRRTGRSIGRARQKNVHSVRSRSVHEQATDRSRPAPRQAGSGGPHARCPQA